MKNLLERRDPQFWTALKTATNEAESAEDLLVLSRLRKKAAGIPGAPASSKSLRLAIIGGYSFYPLSELLEHLLAVSGVSVELFVGEFDNYIPEILAADSRLLAFRPEVVLFLPAERHCQYEGGLSGDRSEQEAEAVRKAGEVLELCRKLGEATGAEVIVSNFILPAGFDPGAYRTRSLGSDWSFRKRVNLELGLAAPSFVHLCDAEFLSCRRGTLASRDPRHWFESKQPCSPALLLDLARETAHLIEQLRRAPRKVLVLDLDNTLWGGVIGDDGLDGIELGDTSPRGEAFKAFQRYVLSLSQRGVLLAVCSKNDQARAMEAFEKHPEMVLRPEHIVSFKANWEPKSDNLRAIAAELDLGLDSLVFVDDNPAEIEIVRQFAPEVKAVLLGPDPADYVGRLQDSRSFEPRSITKEDESRTTLYRQRAERAAHQASMTDMPAYLRSLEMTGVIAGFEEIDVARIAQLINKSNQFNLTTRRRTEGEVRVVASDKGFDCFTVRLNDRFGEHGLISIVICEAEGETLVIDTWLMSCRVLNRQVEHAVANEIFRLARARGCRFVRGAFIPTAKNGMVEGHYPLMGFERFRNEGEASWYQKDVASHVDVPTHIRISRGAE
jgi:FkbH-like protein